MQLEDVILFSATIEPLLRDFDLAPVKVLDPRALWQSSEYLDGIDYWRLFLCRAKFLEINYFLLLPIEISAVWLSLAECGSLRLGLIKYCGVELYPVVLREGCLFVDSEP